MDNIRIKYVGFVFGTTNYLVDFDNREVTYKNAECTIYTKINNLVSVFSNPITKSSVLTFKLPEDKYVAEIEIFSNCITHCSVSLISTENHDRIMLEKDLFTYDYFSMDNMLDIENNISTFVDYNEVFDLTEEDLLLLFTHEQSINFIKRIIENINGQINFIDIIKGILGEVKSKITHEVEP